MHPLRKQRLFYIIIVLIALSLATALVLYALKQNINYFHGPSDVLSGEIKPEQSFRLGGLVKPGSVQYLDGYNAVIFNVTDNVNDVEVHYTGILPDLFLEGESVVAQGKLNTQGIFIASEVLAKHDNNYMPKEVADLLDLGYEQ